MDDRELEASLARALDEVEEQRIVAIELRMLLDASESRLRTMADELEEARSAAKGADDLRENSRVEAIEMRVILDATEHRAAALESELAELRQDGEERGRETSRLNAELTQASGERQVRDALLEEARERLERGDRAVEELELLRADFEAQRCSLEAGLQEARAHLGELEERAASLAREASEGANERAGLRVQIETLQALKDSFERENEELRQGAVHAVAFEQQREENALLRQRLEELESQHAEAAQRHSTAVSKYMLELNQRSEELRGTATELAEARNELELARQMCDDSAEELTLLRQENEGLERQLREQSDAARPARPKTEGLRLADATAEKPAATDASDEIEVEAPRKDVDRGKLRPLTVVHLEDRPEYRAALEETVALYPRMHYIAMQQMPPARQPGPCLLVVNLLVAGLDPVAAVRSADAWGLPEPMAYTYCADAGRGVALGMIEYFPEPFDPDAFAARLLAREEGVQRLLVVSDNIDLMNEIRSTMARFKCSTSGALDARQAFELASLVRPEFVLVDLALPRGEGLRLVARLRADPKTAALPLAFLWGHKLDPSDIRAHAARVARDAPLGVEEFKRALQQALNERGVRSEPLRETA